MGVTPKMGDYVKNNKNNLEHLNRMIWLPALQATENLSLENRHIRLLNRLETGRRNISGCDQMTIAGQCGIIG